MRRALVLVLAIPLALASLTGCVKNLPHSAVDWLADQDGVAEAQILADNTGPWSSSGLVRGDLDPGLSDAALESLVEKVRGYVGDDGRVAFRLGYHQLDFAVDDDAAATDQAIANWQTLLDIPTLTTGYAFADQVAVRTLRADAVDALAGLSAMPVDVRLEVFSEQGALHADTVDDDQRGQQENPLALDYLRAADCRPDPAVSDFALSLADRDDVPGGVLDLCAGLRLFLPAGTAVSTASTALRAELDAAGLTEFPVSVREQKTDAGDTHTAAVTPGDPAALSVLAALDASATPVAYDLDADRNLGVTAYGSPTADLLALVAQAPAAASLTSITLDGEPVVISGPFAALAGLLSEGTALAASATTFGSITLAPGFAQVYLVIPEAAGSIPDAAAAVAELRASGLCAARDCAVLYLNYQVDITGGTAAIHDPGYVGADVMLAFVDAWNAA